MPHFELIVTITGGLATALAFGFAMHRMGLSPIVGYLLAGMVAGPHVPGFEVDEKVASELAEVGVILLMFGVGLQFHFKELLAVRRVAVLGALFQIAGATALGTLLACGWGYSLSGGIVFGLALSVASTVVLVRVLAENRDLHSRAGRTAVGWLVMEDIFTIFALVVLPLLFGPKASQSSLGTSLVLSTLKLIALVLAVAVVGRRVIPRLFGYIAMTRSRELFTLTVLVTALGIAVGSATLFGASMALGAFLAGIIVGQSEFSARAASDALPMRDAFAVLFFMSVGMLFDPSTLMESPLRVLATLLIVVLAKPLLAYLIVKALGGRNDVALPVSAVLAQIGEFSFVLSSTAIALGILPHDAASLLVAVSILSITLNGFLYKLAKYLVKRTKPELNAASVDERTERGSTDAERAVVVGYGPTGQVVCEILRDNGVDVSVIDLNIETVRELNAKGFRSVYGDATRPEVLAEGGLAGARALFLTAPSIEGSPDIIRVAKEVNPRIRVYARSEYLRDVGGLVDAGATSVVSAEGEVALAMASALLGALGASPEQLDHERDRVHVLLQKRILQHHEPSGEEPVEEP